MPYLLGASFYLRKKDARENSEKREDVSAKRALVERRRLLRGKFYWRITMRSPRRNVRIRIEN